MRYREELKGKQVLLDKLVEKAREGNVTLLYSSKETEHNNAVALKGLLDKRMASLQKWVRTNPSIKVFEGSCSQMVWQSRSGLLRLQTGAKLRLSRETPVEEGTAQD